LQLAIDNVETARTREALAALDHIDRDADFGEGWASYWATRIEALHIMGDHNTELAVARDGLRRHPELRVLRNYELRALASLGRVEEVQLAMRALAAQTTTNGSEASTTLRQTAMEYAAHGYRNESIDVLKQMRAWYFARPVAERATLAYQGALARTLYLLDDRRGARTVYDSLLRVYPGCMDCVGALGVLAARDGNRTVADSLSARLEATVQRWMFGRNILWQSRIAASLGDNARAESFVNAAYSAGSEFDVMTHADPDLLHVKPEHVYRVFADAN
jgi:hypothetical protein